MDHIAQQLKAEIESLREYIERTEGHLQATRWVGELLDPFEAVEHDFAPGELRSVVSALYHARYRFSVNGNLAGRIDAILARHKALAAEARAALRPDAPELPARDPESYTPGPAEGDDEEEARQQGGAAPLAGPFQAFELRDAEPSTADDLFAPAVGADASPFSLPDLSEPLSRPDGTPAAPAPPASPPPVGGPQPRLPELPVPLPDAPAGDLLPGALFASPAPDAAERQRARRRREPGEPGPSEPQERAPVEAAVPEVEILAAKVSLEDVVTRLEIGIPSVDRIQLQTLLRNRLSDRVVAGLQTSSASTRRFVLLPRLTRFVYDGVVYPCTVKSIARTFIGLFGDIHDLISLRGEPFFTEETPLLGWALITPEAPLESLDKTFTEQTQYLRLLAGRAGVPSHLVRRRTLVEAVWDLVVGRMVLSMPVQRRTLDWTSTSTSRNDFLCLFNSDRGIRLRELPRTTHNRALGVVPTC